MKKDKTDSINYLKEYWKLNITDDIIKKIEKHCKRYNLDFAICAWYSDWNDFCSDWCEHCGYTRTEARNLLHGGLGEFQIIKNFGIIRYEI